MYREVHQQFYFNNNGNEQLYAREYNNVDDELKEYQYINGKEKAKITRNAFASANAFIKRRKSYKNKKATTKAITKTKTKTKRKAIRKHRKS
jgi:hypothetical protein